MKLSGWGNFPVAEVSVFSPRSPEELSKCVSTADQLIARGGGRAYGDSAMNPQLTVEMRHLNRLVSFDDATGQLVAEAGVLLADVIETFLPRGWFPAVTPGTKFVTLGGMVAADVHGKNHHRDGSFGSFIDWIEVIGKDGAPSKCSANINNELFQHTVGGMGLTGVIITVAFRLRRIDTAWIRETVRPFRNLQSLMHAFDAAGDCQYSVAWIDCFARGDKLGRSLLMTGEHVKLNELPGKLAQSPLAVPARKSFSFPFFLPAWALSGHAVKWMNTAYHAVGAARQGMRLVDWDGFFYPLDSLRDWNRMYGRRGFIQFQCVFPLKESETGLRNLLQEISQRRTGSFLAVLKRFGPQVGRFSFPMEGYSLALDFPVSPQVMYLMERLDRIVVDRGGRFYLAKDSRMSPEVFNATDPRFSDFRRARKTNGWEERFSSLQSQRLVL